MAETLSVTDMLPNKFEPKRQFRWVFAIEGVDAFLMKTAARPQMAIAEKEIPFIYVEDQAYLAEAAGMSLGTRTAAIAVMEVEKEAEDKFKEVNGHCTTLSE